MRNFQYAPHPFLLPRHFWIKTNLPVFFFCCFRQVSNSVSVSVLLPLASCPRLFHVRVWIVSRCSSDIHPPSLFLLALLMMVVWKKNLVCKKKINSENMQWWSRRRMEDDGRESKTRRFRFLFWQNPPRTRRGTRNSVSGLFFITSGRRFSGSLSLSLLILSTNSFFFVKKQIIFFCKKKLSAPRSPEWYHQIIPRAK